MTINPKMQPKTAVQYRHWQHFNTGAYYYGECPKCGAAAQPDFPMPAGEHITEEECECEVCGCKFLVQTTTVYRFAGLNTD